MTNSKKLKTNAEIKNELLQNLSSNDFEILSGYSYVGNTSITGTGFDILSEVHTSRSACLRSAEGKRFKDLRAFIRETPFIKIGNKFYKEITINQIVHGTKEDDENDLIYEQKLKKIEAKKEALKRAEALGLSKEDLELLKS